MTERRDHKMDPVDSPLGWEEELLEQLLDYCRAVIHAVDTPKRLIQVVFFDDFLSTTSFPPSFPDISELSRIITELRARLCFGLFGIGGPGKVDSATLLETLAAWYSQSLTLPSIQSSFQSIAQSLAQAPVAQQAAWPAKPPSQSLLLPAAQ